MKELICSKELDKGYSLLFGKELDEAMIENLKVLNDALSFAYGKTLGDNVEANNRICFGLVDEKAKEIYQALPDDAYAHCFFEENGKKTLYVVFKTNIAGLCALDRLLEENVCADGFVIKEDFVQGICKKEDAILTSKLPKLRDPYIVIKDDVFYAYGTDWKYYKNTSKNLLGEWEGPYFPVVTPTDADTNFWAPEVHFYKGFYYMFTTYHSAKTNHRGCSIFKSASPEGPFVEITNGHFTPADWDSIDATFYVDEDKQPWTIFVHEWTSMPNKVGTMAIAKLSDDLTHLISEPKEIFTAYDGKWAIVGKSIVTDGCFMVKTEKGLQMLWSNRDKSGYCVGMAKSENGKIDGKWQVLPREFYSASFVEHFEGGHPMIFEWNWQKYMSIHSPNKHPEVVETPTFVPIKEICGQLVWDLYKK